MEQRATIVRYRVLGWLTLAAALSYLCRNAVGVAESTIREDLGLSLVQSGWFMGAFFWTYALFQVPSGLISYRYGTQVVLTVSALGWSFACFGIGIAPGFWLLIAAQLTMGLAQASVFPAACNSIGHWMPFGQRSLACGILTAGMQVGAITASILTGTLMAHLGWRSVFILFALPSIAWAVCFCLRFRDHPEDDMNLNESERKIIRDDHELTVNTATLTPSPDEDITANHVDSANRASPVEELLSPAIWLLCGQQICRTAGYIFFASWFPTFIQKTRGISVEDSGYIQSLVLTGTLVGSLLGGMLTDWVWRTTKNLRLSRSGVGTVSTSLCAVLILGSWYVESTHLAVALMTLGSLFAAIAGPCAFAATIDIGGTRVPQVFGLMNMCGNLAAATSPILVGRLFEWTANWNLVLPLFAGVYLASAGFWLFVKPSLATKRGCE